LVPILTGLRFLEHGIVWKYPAVLTDNVVGEHFSFLRMPKEMLEVILRKKEIIKGIYGIFPANQVNDDN
jgi:5-methyltetrahydrofolate--homocysteine methyltransferase